MNSTSNLYAQLNWQREAFQLDIKLHTPAEGITFVFGASGSGKTTLLRALAGLEKIPFGRVVFKEQTWQTDRSFVPAHKRPIAYVFQEASLLPHLNVDENIRYGWRRVPPSRRRIVLSDAVEWMGIGPLLKRHSHQLSGGQKQRVAIARALLSSPELLLMDEPLAGLDRQSKMDILPFLERLHTELNIPIMFVSHAIEEVIRLADRLVLMDGGRITRQGTANEILTDNTLPLAQADEASALIEGRIVQHDRDYALTVVRVPGGAMSLPHKDLPIDHPVSLRILARDVSVALERTDKSSISNVLPATVMAIGPAAEPSQVVLRLDLGGTVILSRITRRSMDSLGIRPGQAVYAQVKSAALVR